MPIKPLPPLDYLRACFGYDPATGELRWKTRPLEHFVDDVARRKWNTRYPGKIAGAISSGGYRAICLIGYGPRYAKHRIIFKLMTGRDPVLEIDHIDGNRANDRWSNLREATRTQQGQNSANRKNNTSGYRGVFWDKKSRKWRVNIRINNSRYHLGDFDQIEDAGAIYEAAAREAFGEFYRA